MSDEVLFLLYADFEPLAARSPRCGGPQTWEESEELFHTFTDVSRQRGVKLTLCLTPEAAAAQAPLFRAAHADGVELGLQPNVPGFRYPAYTKDLGEYDAETQRRIVGEALEDFQGAIGIRPRLYTPCCGSKSNGTHQILIDYGFEAAVVPGTGRFFTDRPDRCTVGQSPFVHWASPYRTTPGCLPLCIVPVTSSLEYQLGRAPFDVRPDRDASDDVRARYRQVVDQNLEAMAQLRPPVKHLLVGGHNTRYAKRANMEFVIDYCREAVSRKGWRLVPAQVAEVREALAAQVPLA